MSRKEVVQLLPEDGIVEQNKDTIIIERQVPLLDYDSIERNLKHLQGQILTVMEAIIVDKNQQEAAKSLVKGFVNDKLTWMFDLYGHSSESELPQYSDVGEKVS